MTKSKQFSLFCISFLLWVFINNMIESFYISLFFIIFLSLLVYIVLRYKNLFIFSSFILFFALFLWLFISDYHLTKINSNFFLINQFDEKEEYTTKIIRKTKITEDKNIYTAQLIEVSWNKIDNNIKVEVHISGNNNLQKWDKIKFTSKIYYFESFNNFAYDKYMLSQWIYFRIYPYTYELIWQEKINKITRKIENFREKIIKDIKDIYTFEEWIFFAGILVWAREEMPKQLGDNFNNSWLTHIIAVSWFNITILILFFWYITKFFPPSLKLITISTIIILFTMLVWYNPPVIRASIMWIIWYIVLISWRKWDIIWILLLTALLMIIVSPLSLNYDVSFHLSFLAVIWIIFTQKWFEEKLQFLPNILEIRNALCLTLSALVFTFPIMIFNFWQISLISPISNVLVSWTIPIIMLLGFVWLIWYWILPILWIILSYIPWLFLKWDISIVNNLGTLKYGVIKYDLWIVSLYLEIIYFVIIIIFLLLKSIEAKN